VISSGAGTELLVDQSSVDGWTLLGTFDFAEGGQQSVDGFDNMPVPVAGDQPIAFDAVRLTREGLEPPSVDAGAEAPTDPTDGGPGELPDDDPAAGVPGGDAGCTCRMIVGGLAVLAARRRGRQPQGGSQTHR
jgi:hypothetical protein